MTLNAVVGWAKALDGREASLQAIHQALNQMGAVKPGMGIIIASQQYQSRDIASGISGLLGDVPVIGFSSPAGLTAAGSLPHAVVACILGGEDLEAHAHWLPGYAQSSRETATQLGMLARGDKAQHILFFADGFNGDAEQFCQAMSEQPYQVLGGLSSGDLHTGNTFQIAGNQSGTGAVAALTISSKIQVSVGYAHGWNPIGSQMRVTRSRGFWLRTLDARPTSETYAELLGYPAREWGFPPLSHMARLYPLGMEQGDELIIRSPIRVEADGSFRMNAPVRDGVDAFLMVGSRSACQKAAQTATQQALHGLEGAKPILAVVLVDLAWQMLLKATPGAEITAVQDILGGEIPVAGGYTLGQVVSERAGDTPRFLNQHLVVMIFGERPTS